ncbi:MAG: chain length-determining protein [Piscirickettsiaceae bacterium]|nr:MAG: chain length-determining protein [Piscirickettsiaceae bacterium]PCI70160.1 MAG: chain length-determining protein [Piscirickettsiaceae bacterium]
MNELFSIVFHYLHGISRFKWTVLIVAWLFALIGWLMVYQMPNKYEATARVHIDSNRVLRPLMRGITIQTNVDRRVSLLSRTLMSRPNLEKLARMADLDLTVETDAQKEAMLSGLAKNIKLLGDRRNGSLYTVKYVHAEKETAKKTVQALISIFIEQILGDKRQDSSEAGEFLDQQINEYEKRLIETENKLSAFKQKNMGVLPGENSSYFGRLESTVSALKVAELELREVTNRRNSLKNQLSGDDPVFLPSGGSAAPDNARVASLRQRLDSLLVRYTDKHPEVVQIRATIKRLQEEGLATQAGSGFDVGGAIGSLSYQNMRTMLAEADGRVAELSIRVREYRNRVKNIKSKVSSLPVIEAQLKKFTRDYSIVKEQYNALLKRRESAHLSGEMESNADDVKFKVIDPPFVPSKPTEPNKLLLNSAVLIVAAGLAIGVGLLIALVQPVITSRHRLSRVSGLPILGAVSLIEEVSVKRKAINIILVTIPIVALLAAFAGVNFIEGLLPF